MYPPLMCPLYCGTVDNPTGNEDNEAMVNKQFAHLTQKTQQRNENPLTVETI